MNEIITKSSRIIGILKKICFRCGWTFLEVYKIYILPVIEYANQSWCWNQTQTDRLEGLQKRVTKIICNKLGFNNLDYDIRLRLLSLKSLKHRKTIIQMKLLKQMFDSEHDLLTLTSTRNGILLKPMYHRLVTCKRHFYYSIITVFNSFPRNIRDSILTDNFITNVDDYLEFNGLQPVL